MGYTTEFVGQFNLDRPLEENHKAYLERFAETRRMKRDAVKCQTLPDSIREAVGLPVGVEGEYYLCPGRYEDSRDASVVDYNEPPSTQPGLWCQWVPNEDGTAIVWDEGEKFYYYAEWLEYIVKNFLIPWGYKLNGVVEWSGEESGDLGAIEVTDNKIEVMEAVITYKRTSL